MCNSLAVEQHRCHWYFSPARELVAVRTPAAMIAAVRANHGGETAEQSPLGMIAVAWRTDVLAYHASRAHAATVRPIAAKA